VRLHPEFPSVSGSGPHEAAPRSGSAFDLLNSHTFRITTAVTFLILLGVALSNAAELKQTTLQGWNSYVRTVTSSIEQRANGTSVFLWVDESPDLKKRVLAGEALVASHDHDKVPSGLIHHWVGAMFFPGASLDQVLTVLNDYDRYKDIYAPMIMKSRLLERSGADEKVNLLLVAKVVGVTGAVDTDNEVRTAKLDSNRMYFLNRSVRSQEIANYGQPRERMLPQDRGPGYVWRTFGVTRLQQRDGGVYLEMETVTLSRGIPWEFRWLVEPVTERLPRSIMTRTLNDTREAIKKAAGPAAAEH
jgi:hypothetical protein